MKKKSYVVSIEKPCSEDWTDMPPTTNGRYCLHCAKTVVDFTGMTDSQITAFITQQRNNGKTSFCGNFRNEQLNRPLDTVPATHNHFFVLPVMVAGALALSSCHENTRTSDTPSTIIQNNTTQSTNTAPWQGISLYGKVHDITMKGMKKVTVTIEGTSYSTVTEEDGSFSFTKIPEKDYILKVQHKDYETAYGFYHSGENKGLDILLCRAPEPAASPSCDNTTRGIVIAEPTIVKSLPPPKPETIPEKKQQNIPTEKLKDIPSTTPSEELKETLLTKPQH